MKTIFLFREKNLSISRKSTEKTVANMIMVLHYEMRIWAIFMIYFLTVQTNIAKLHKKSHGY